MEIAYPIVIVISIPILIFLILKKFKKEVLYLQGKKIANTKYAQETEYYKKLFRKYKILVKSVKVVCIICIIISTILTARIVKIDRQKNDMYNRDIFLCMDVSTSVDELNVELVESLKDIISELHGERFGISIFNTSSVVLSPLTDDYEYVNDILNTLHRCFNMSLMRESYSSYYWQYLYGGTLVGNEERGSSLIGDGLASCVLNFPKLNEKRTRIIIFSTDNDLAGKEIYSLSEAASLAKDNNVIVYGIAPNSIRADDEISMRMAIEKTGGKYYTTASNTTVKDIVKEIESKAKNVTETKTNVRVIDYPQVPFVLLLISIIVLYVLNKKVNL